MDAEAHHVLLSDRGRADASRVLLNPRHTNSEWGGRVRFRDQTEGKDSAGSRLSFSYWAGVQFSVKNL